MSVVVGTSSLGPWRMIVSKLPSKDACRVSIGHDQLQGVAKRAHASISDCSVRGQANWMSCAFRSRQVTPTSEDLERACRDQSSRIAGGDTGDV